MVKNKNRQVVTCAPLDCEALIFLLCPKIKHKKKDPQIYFTRPLHTSNFLRLQDARSS